MAVQAKDLGFVPMLLADDVVELEQGEHMRIFLTAVCTSWIDSAESPNGGPAAIVAEEFNI
jgi:hypothetical protein